MSFTLAFLCVISAVKERRSAGLLVDFFSPLLNFNVKHATKNVIAHVLSYKFGFAGSFK